MWGAQRENKNSKQPVKQHAWTTFRPPQAASPPKQLPWIEFSFFPPIRSLLRRASLESWKFSLLHDPHGKTDFSLRSSQQLVTLILARQGSAINKQIPDQWTRTIFIKSLENIETLSH